MRITVVRGDITDQAVDAVVNAANDIGEYWEFSDQGFSPVPDNEAYKLGVNYLIYALTH